MAVSTMSALRTVVIYSRRQEEDFQRPRNARELTLPPVGIRD